MRRVLRVIKARPNSVLNSSSSRHVDTKVKQFYEKKFTRVSHIPVSQTIREVITGTNQSADQSKDSNLLVNQPCMKLIREFALKNDFQSSRLHS